MWPLRIASSSRSRASNRATNRAALAITAVCCLMEIPGARRALRGLLPGDIVRRRKHGVAVPVSEWLRGASAHVVDDLLGPGIDRRADHLDRHLRQGQVMARRKADHAAGSLHPGHAQQRVAAQVDLEVFTARWIALVSEVRAESGHAGFGIR